MRWKQPKKCGKCGETDQAKFYKTAVWCRACHREATRDSRYRKLGVSRDEYLAVLHGQMGACAICGSHERSVDSTKPGSAKTRGLHLDHDHKTGKRRGILCWNCNQTLGRVKDSTELLQSMIAYINKYL